MIRALAALLFMGCTSSDPAPRTEAGVGCAAPQPSTMCIFCGGDVAVQKECRDGAWLCPSGSNEKCEPSCTGTGPICCPESGDAGPTSATCTGRETWQCPLGTVPKSACSS